MGGPGLVQHSVNYTRIFYYLIALTALTVLGSLYRAPNELVNVGIALGIATTKAFFVVSFFMHLKFEGKLIYTIFFAPLTLAIVLTIALIPRHRPWPPHRVQRPHRIFRGDGRSEPVDS